MTEYEGIAKQPYHIVQYHAFMAGYRTVVLRVARDHAGRHVVAPHRRFVRRR